uniref:DUF4220 domain-containing protein n=1 Tax=Aegilops tauschii TaxID=37682 RepID=M8BUT3_AEGTA
MDVLAPSIHRLLYHLMSKTKVTALCETLPSYNLIGTALQEGDKSIGWIYMCARSMGFNCNFNCFCRPQLGQVHSIEVTQNVIIDLMETQDRDLASYMIFNSSNWVLSKELREHCGVEIKQCLRVSFDRSVLLWHIATDLCFRCDDLVDDVGEQEARYGGGLQRGGGRVVEGIGEGVVEGIGEGEVEGIGEGVVIEEGRVLGLEEVPQQQMRRDPSLQLHTECTFGAGLEEGRGEVVEIEGVPQQKKEEEEMLLSGSRHHLISEAMEEIKSSFLSKKDKLSQKEQLKGLIADMAEGDHKSVNGDDNTSQGFVHITEACKLAKELLELPDPRTRWMLMCMLCYSASMCRGYLHAKSLGEGGEHLTFIWLALMLKGAKSLVDKLQMPPETQASDDAGSQA